MTQTFKNMFLLVLVAIAFGVLAVALLPEPGSAAGTRVDPAGALHRIDAVPAAAAVDVSDQLVLAAVGAGADVSAAQVTDIHLAADRVCEGFVAGVPVTTMEQVVAGEQGLTLGAAHAFVEAVHAVQCPLL